MESLQVSIHLNEAEMVPKPQLLPIPTMELSFPDSERLHFPLPLHLLRNMWLVFLNSLSHRFFLPRVFCRYRACAFTQFFRVTTVTGKVKHFFYLDFQRDLFSASPPLLFSEIAVVPNSRNFLVLLSGKQLILIFFSRPTLCPVFFFLVN